HYMLQAFCMPVAFPDPVWSIERVAVKYSKDIFNYKDETNNLSFSLGMNGFGIIACLQDNGANKEYHAATMQLIDRSRSLHPIQFEELCGRYLYSNYLLNSQSNYHFEKSNGGVRVVADEGSEAEFRPWDDSTYAQVLANYWKPWGIDIKFIDRYPNSTKSYLIDDRTGEFIPAARIGLPF